MMKQDIVIVGADIPCTSVLCSELKRHYFGTLPLTSLAELEDHLARISCRTVIIDLDSLPADRGFFNKLKQLYPDLNLLVISERTFHPELREAIAEQIFACVKKPVDTEEIVFLLRSIETNRNG